MNIYLKLLLVSMAWGGTFIAVRTAAQFMGPFEGSFLRFCFAVVGLWLVLFFSKEHIPKLSKKMFFYNVLLALSGIIAYNFFFFSALKILPASRASLLVALNPTIILFASSLIFKEKLTWKKVLGALIALLGALVVISRGNLLHIFDHIGWGEVLAFGCPVTWAVYTLLSKIVLKEQSPLLTTFFASLFGTIGLLPLALSEGLHLGTIPPIAWLALAYLGVFGTVIGFVWYTQGIKKIGAAQTAVFNNLVPVFSVLLAALVLHEPITASIVMGGAMVVLGVALINFL